MVTPSATELLVIVYAPIEVGQPQLDRVVAVTAERLATINGGSRVSSR
jgi:hypothetical protein